MAWRIASALFAVLFAVGAIVQWNDPDPLLWMLGYGVACALSIASVTGRALFWPNVAAAIVFGAWFIWLAPSLVGAPGEAFESFSMQAPSHEEPREAGGLALLAGWSIVLAVRARGQARRDGPDDGNDGNQEEHPT